MQTHNPLASFAALAMLAALMDPARRDAKAAPASNAGPSAATAGDAAPKDFAQMSGPGMLGTLFGEAPHCAGDCAAGEARTERSIFSAVHIPKGIAERAGMNAPDFDSTTPMGRLIGMLAGAQATLHEMVVEATTDDAAAKYQLALGRLGLAINALNGQPDA